MDYRAIWYAETASYAVCSIKVGMYVKIISMNSLCMKYLHNFSGGKSVLEWENGYRVYNDTQGNEHLHRPLSLIPQY